MEGKDSNTTRHIDNMMVAVVGRRNALFHSCSLANSEAWPCSPIETLQNEYLSGGGRLRLSGCSPGHSVLDECVSFRQKDDPEFTYDRREINTGL
jgi:hypothetical protein